MHWDRIANKDFPNLVAQQQYHEQHTAHWGVIHLTSARKQGETLLNYSLILHCCFINCQCPPSPSPPLLRVSTPFLTTARVNTQLAQRIQDELHVLSCSALILLDPLSAILGLYWQNATLIQVISINRHYLMLPSFWVLPQDIQIAVHKILG